MELLTNGKITASSQTKKDTVRLTSFQKPHLESVLFVIFVLLSFLPYKQNTHINL